VSRLTAPLVSEQEVELVQGSPAAPGHPAPALAHANVAQAPPASAALPAGSDPAAILAPAAAGAPIMYTGSGFGSRPDADVVFVADA
jgi:hypothetical protein